MQRLSDSTLLGVCRRCITFLQSTFSSEMGLLRCSVSQVEVRGLRDLLINDLTLKPPKSSDIYVVAEVLQLSLRHLQTSVLDSAYDDVIANDHDWSCAVDGVRMVRSWLAKGPQEVVELLSSLFDVLHRVAFVNDREADLRTLAYTISPSLCCPRQYAYMSIKHQHDLEKIRPAVAFMIKHSGRIFSGGVVPGPAVPLTLCAVSQQDGAEQSGERSPTLIRPNLTVIIPSAEAVAPKPTIRATPRSMGHGRSKEEWAILQALVLGTTGEAFGLDFSPAACLPEAETEHLQAFLAAIPAAPSNSGFSPLHAAVGAPTTRSPCTAGSLAGRGALSPHCRSASPRQASAVLSISSPTGVAKAPRSPHSHSHAPPFRTPHAAEARSPHDRTHTPTASGDSDYDWKGIAEEEPSPRDPEERPADGRVVDKGGGSHLDEAARRVQRAFRRSASRRGRRGLGGKCAGQEELEVPQTARSERTAEEEAYSVLVEEKAELEARLRRYDCEFERTRGRAQRRSGKEGDSPLHRVYTQMKAKLRELRRALLLPCS